VSGIGSSTWILIFLPFRYPFAHCLRCTNLRKVLMENSSLE